MVVRIEPIIVGDQGDFAGPATAQQVEAELARQRREFDRLLQITERINRGGRLEEILDYIWEEFRDVIPFNRISFASIDYERGRVVSTWARSQGPAQVVEGYSHDLGGTSLLALARSGRPRIINDLEAYTRERPESEVTHMLVQEGLRSSLTCPLVVEGRPVGFLFFDSQERAAYSNVHVEFFMQIAGVISAVVDRGRMFSELARRNETIEMQNRMLAESRDRMNQELEMARAVQSSLIPKTLRGCSSVELAMLYEPASIIGGDLLDAIRLGEGKAVVYVADAMGHGVPAALLMSVVSTAFRVAVTQSQGYGLPNPGALLTEVNRTVMDLFDMNYVTAACGVVDTSTNRLILSLAGHPPALVVRKGSGELVEVPSCGIPLGIEEDSTYESTEVPFDVGDELLLYTDGVIEAPRGDGERYGLDMLKAFLGQWRGKPLEAMVSGLRQELSRFCERGELDDDMTVLAVKRLT